MDGYGGRVAGVSGLWRNGAGCGTCYQVLIFSLIFFSTISFLFLQFISRVSHLPMKQNIHVGTNKYLIMSKW